MVRLLDVTLFFLPLLLGAAFVEPFFFDFDPMVAEKGKNKPDYETDYGGSWELVSENSGVSAMHLVITHENKAIMFDSAIFRPSQLALPAGNCRKVIGSKIPGEEDCWAHAVEFDIDTADVRALKTLTDTWCSSGSFAADGTLVQTGGWNDGGRAVRYLETCQTCDWQEYPVALAGVRWYSTQQILPDGAFVVIGGRREFNYEYVPPAGTNNVKSFDLPFLKETTDYAENNLYPFVHLSTDGNLFVFANNRAILLDVKTNTVVRKYPTLNGGSRNYPASGMSVLLPINLQHARGDQLIPAEVVVCGGSPTQAFKLAEKGIFGPALKSCGRITITKPDARWHIEQMPMARTMGDMLNLPNGEVLIINGASKGCAGWDFGRDPVLEPVLYRPNLRRDQRFTTLTATTIPRMYHSTSAVLPDATILVAGSNTNNAYKFDNVMYATEVRVERFYPPYLDTLLSVRRPTIDEYSAPNELKYGEKFEVNYSITELLGDGTDVKVTMYAPPFTTHGYSMNQRLIVLKIEEIDGRLFGRYRATVTAPPSGKVAPPGYYMLFVVHRGVPSKAVWVHIQ